jgi:hypothetical protein
LGFQARINSICRRVGVWAPEPVMTGTAPLYFQMPSRASTPPFVSPIDSVTWTRSNGRTPCM